jgi:hypothetical protein
MTMKRKSTGVWRRKMAALTAASRDEYADDLTKQISIRGEDAVDNLIPKGELNEYMHYIAQGTPLQRKRGFERAVSNAVKAGLVGAGIAGVAQGTGAIPAGLSIAVPPSLVQGYLDGQREQQRSEVASTLQSYNV